MEQLRADDPQRIGAYRLLGRLGTGGMGRVFLARSDRGRIVAVKLVRAELAAQEEFRTRFRREVLAARRVGGKWTAPVLDADTEAEIPWVATGYVAGPSLQQVVKDYGPLPERSVTVLAAGLAHALADIHTAGLVHRDLKPSNVMITIDGPRVIDFGIARALETVADGSATLTHTGAMVGSPAFMSPEQVRGDRVTPACDVFCLGSVLAYAVTGLQPFGAAGSGVHAQMFRIVQEPPDLDAVPAGLRGLVTACLVKEPERRPSLAEVLELIEGAADEPAEDTPPGRVEPWLPGAIVAQLGRHAVQLLELEADAEAEAGATAPTVVSEQRPPVMATGTESPRTTAAPPPEPGPGGPPAGQRGRKGRRGALVAVLALLAVMAGGATAYVVVKQDDGSGTQAAPPLATGAPAGTSEPAPPSHTATATPTATDSATATAGPTETPGETPTETAVPADSAGADPADPADPAAPDGAVAPPGDLVGTWEASFTSSPGVIDTRTLTVGDDGSVQLAGQGTKGGQTTYSCVWSMSVTAVGPPTEVGPSQVDSGRPATSCLPGGPTTLTLVDDTHLQRELTDDRTVLLTYEKTA